jgi:MoxR-like ATPase
MNSATLVPAVLRADEGHRLVHQVLEQMGQVVRGQQRKTRILLASVLAGGHVLLEDVPGVGKTTLARTLAKVLGNRFSRIQFTADMLPADVLGVQVLSGGRFEFRPGPLFAQVVLADEINRASPKTQSAMLEAMGEGAVTIDDQTYPLPQPFLVIATQNPVEQHGAYPLPESQLDRFGVSLSLGYPGRLAEKTLLLAPNAPQRHLDGLTPVLDPHTTAALQGLAAAVTITEPVADYLLSIVEATRNHADIVLGCSPRGALAFAALARAWAFMEGRGFVRPDDMKEMATYALSHRISVATSGTHGRARARTLIAELLDTLEAPR